MGSFTYATKTLIINGHRIEISVPWRDKPHLSLGDDGHTLHLNASQMAADLRNAFDRYEAHLRRDGVARDAFLRRRREEREVQPALRSVWG